MAYFSSFPSVFYNNSEATDATRTLVTNILVSPKFTEFFSVEGQQLYNKYIVQNLERPEYLAYKYYGDASLYWIILLFNSITDPYFEWPLSDDDLENHIQKNYAGTAIFVDPTFYKSNEVQTYQSSQSFLEIGETVTQGSKTATILEWDPTLLKMVVDSTVGFTIGSSAKITTSNRYGTIKLIPRRVEQDNTYAIHHFEDSNGNILDPYNNLSTGGDFTSSYLYYYTVLDSQGLNASAISNRQFEIDANDRKRNIKILKPQYVQYVLSELEAMFKK